MPGEGIEAAGIIATQVDEAAQPVRIDRPNSITGASQPIDQSGKHLLVEFF